MQQIKWNLVDKMNLMSMLTIGSSQAFLQYFRSPLIGTGSHFQLDWKSVCACEQAQEKPLKKKQDKIFGVQIDPEYDIAHGKEASEGSSKPMRDRKVHQRQNGCGHSHKRVMSQKLTTRLKRKIRRPMRLYWHHFITVVTLMFLECMGRCQVGGSELIRTDQPLPPECLQWIRKWDCPLKDTFKSEWGDLNALCCSGFPTDVLHCQQGHLFPGDNGSYSHDFPACLHEQIVLAGYAGRLDNSTGSPRFLTELCEPSWYEDKDRNSSEVLYPYCTKRKSICSGEGQVYLTRGDTSHNALCTCGSGYKPDSDTCLAGFDDDSHCGCEVDRVYPPGQHVSPRSDLPTTPTPPIMNSPTTRTPHIMDSRTTSAVMDASMTSRSDDAITVTVPKTDDTLIFLPVVVVIAFVIVSVCLGVRWWKPQIFNSITDKLSSLIIMRGLLRKPDHGLKGDDLGKPFYAD